VSAFILPGIFITFFLLVDRLLRFLKELGANPGNLSTNGKRGEFHSQFEKLLVNWKSFGVKQLGTF
jgi:hypothetical protein